MSDQLQFYIDIEDGSGNKLGSGPLQSVSRWRYTARFDRAGSIDFDFAANDPQAGIVTNRRIARARALIGGSWVEVGAGRIDAIDTAPGNDGRVSLSASGLDLIAELGDRSVGSLEIGAGSGATHAAALTAIGALAPAGWTFTPAASPDNDYIYARYGGESVLGALVYLAERTETHFYRSADRTLVFTSDFADSGVRAIQATGDLAAETCAIVGLRRTVDTHDLLTRIYPYGSGQGEARLTLAATSRTAPAGYTLNKAANYIEANAAKSAYGLVDHPEIEFKEITPISNTDADLQAAANMLFDAALEELRRRSTLADQRTYSLTVAGCSQLLRPMQTIRVVYRDVSQGISIDEDLYILEATWEVDESGVRTSQLVVSTQDRWPDSDTSAAAERAVQGRVFQAHPQMGPNSYTIAYSKNVDALLDASFRFRLGSEIVTLQQVLFEYQVLPFESTVRSVSSQTATSSNGGSSTPTTSSGGGTTSSSGGTHSHTVTISGHTHTVTIPNHTHGLTLSDHAHSINLSDHTHSVTLADHTHQVTIGDHSHDIPIVDTPSPGSPSISNLSFDRSNDIFVVSVSGTGTADYAATTDGGGGTTVSSGGGGGTTVSSAGGGGVSTTTGNGGGTVTSTSSGGATTPTTSSGGSTTPTSSSDGSHTHTVAAHTHTVTIPAHTHTVTPDIQTQYGIFRDSAANTLGVDQLEYRVNGGSWASLEDDSTDAGDGWYQLDITSLVMDSSTFRPLQTNNLIEIRGNGDTYSINQLTGNDTSVSCFVSGTNDLEAGQIITISGTTNFNGTYSIVSIAPSGSLDILELSPGKSSALATELSGTVTVIQAATIDAQLAVRNTIQAIAYT